MRGPGLGRGYAALLCVVLGCASSCGSRTDLAVFDRADARIAPADASASCALRCDVEPIAVDFALHSNWVDVAPTVRGWLVVHGDEDDRHRLHIDRVMGERVTPRSVDLAVEVEEPRIAMQEAARLGVVVFRSGLLWIDGEGSLLSEVVTTGAPERWRGGRPFALRDSFVLRSGDHAAGSMDRGLETALIAPLAEVVHWERVSEAPLLAGTMPDFERREDGVVGAWTLFTRRKMFLAWMDERGGPRATLLVDAPEPTPGRIDRFGADVAALDDRVVALRATTRRDSEGRIDRVITVDVFDEAGGVEHDLFDTPVDPDRFFMFMEVLRRTIVAVYDHEGVVRLLPLMGDCPGSEPIDLVAGFPVFFDAIGPDEGLLVTRDDEDRGRLHAVRCDAAP